MAKLLIAGWICILLTAHARATGEKAISLSEEQRTEFLAEHNKLRAAVNVEPLEWDETVAKSATVHAEECKFAHSQGIPYGENLFYSGGPGSEVHIASKSVLSWGEEKKFFKDPKKWQECWPQCGHYSAIVWRETKKVGCAIIHCPKYPNLVVCQYNPAGNWIGYPAY